MVTKSVLVLVLLLAACSTDVKPIAPKNDLSNVKGLEDCKVWTGYMEGRVTIVRCPNSATSTTYQLSKTTTATTVVIER